MQWVHHEIVVIRISFLFVALVLLLAPTAAWAAAYPGGSSTPGVGPSSGLFPSSPSLPGSPTFPGGSSTPGFPGDDPGSALLPSQGGVSTALPHASGSLSFTEANILIGLLIALLMVLLGTGLTWAARNRNTA